jgi:hypothetical protein
MNFKISNDVPSGFNRNTYLYGNAHAWALVDGAQFKLQHVLDEHRSIYEAIKEARS